MPAHTSRAPGRLATNLIGIAWPRSLHSLQPQGRSREPPEVAAKAPGAANYPGTANHCYSLRLLISAAVGFLRQGRRPGRLPRLAEASALAAFVVACLSATLLAMRGAGTGPVAGLGSLGLSVRLDAVSTVMLLLVMSGNLVQLFALDERGHMAWRYAGDLQWVAMDKTAMPLPRLNVAV